MFRRFLLTVIFLFSVILASGQVFSIEAGTGIRPAHMELTTPTWRNISGMVGRGQDIGHEGIRYPTLSFSGVWRTSLRNEFIVTAGISWTHFQLMQYGTFGVDPKGKPRYDLSVESSLGWRDAYFVPSLTCTFRHLWNPGHFLVFYSALGFGFIPETVILPIPGITPIGLRAGGRHLYLFAEATLSTVSTLAHGGIGWHFTSPRR